MCSYAIKKNNTWVSFYVPNEKTGFSKSVKIADVKKKISLLIPGCDLKTLCTDYNCPVIIYDFDYMFKITDFI